VRFIKPTAARTNSVDFVKQRRAREQLTITSSLIPASVVNNMLFDIFEPDTRGAAYSDEIISTVRGFAVGDPSSSAIPAMASSATSIYKSTATQTDETITPSAVCNCTVKGPSSSSISAGAPFTTSTSKFVATQTEEVNTAANTTIQAVGDIHAKDIYIGSLSESATDVAKDENFRELDSMFRESAVTTATSQELVVVPRELVSIPQDPAATTQEAGAISQEPVVTTQEPVVATQELAFIPQETAVTIATFQEPAVTTQKSAGTIQETGDTSQEPASTTQESTTIASRSATTSQALINTKAAKSTRSAQSSTPKPPTASNAPSNILSETEVQEILDAIPIRDYHIGRDLLPIVGSVEVCEDAIKAAEKSKDGMFEEANALEWKIRLRQTLYSLKIRERQNKAWEENTRLKHAFPAAVVRAKNATDQSICDDLQPLSVALDPKIELQDAIEGWRDTVDGMARDYCKASSGEHWWKYMEYEDSHGIDNNEYHDYFPEVPRKVVYHNTAVQTKQIITPLVHKKVFGREPTKVETRKMIRSIGSTDYVDQSELWYGKPFLDPNGPYLDVQTETQDSGFQTMDFEIREANILKAKAKAGITASKLNKLSIERYNGIRVFVEPSKDRILHSQQFTTLRPIVDKAGTMDSYGNYTPMIHNVIYEDIENTPATTVTQIHAKPLACLSPKSLPQTKTTTMEAMKLKIISSYCRSPSPSHYEEAQINNPELFEEGWPMNQFLLKEVDGTYSQDISKDFAVPDPTRFHNVVREQTHTSTKPNISSHRTGAPFPNQKTPVATKASLAATSAQALSNTMKIPHTPISREDKGRAKKRSRDQLTDEGYKSHSASSASERHRFDERTAASMSHFLTPYDTPLSPDGVKFATPTSARSNSATPKTDGTSIVLGQTSNKRKHEAAPAQESSRMSEQSSSKRPRLQPTPTPVRRLPPTESTLKVIIPKGNLKARAQMNQKKTPPIVAQATHMAPTDGVNAKTARVQQQEPTQQQVKGATSVPPASKTWPAPALSRPSWADRKPTVKRDNNKENPNRWRMDLGRTSLGRRHEPYDASGRPSRRN
jgi:hypothetical protein